MIDKKYLVTMAFLTAFSILLVACGSQATPAQATNAQPNTAFPQENTAVQADTPIPPAETGAPTAEQPAGGVSYINDIQTIFSNSCGGCHGGSGGLSLESYDQLMAGGNSGAMVAAGSPDESILVKRLTGEITPKMPRGGSLSDEQINLIRQWIEEGALNN